MVWSLSHFNEFGLEKIKSISMKLLEKVWLEVMTLFQTSELKGTIHKTQDLVNNNKPLSVYWITLIITFWLDLESYLKGLLVFFGIRFLIKLGGNPDLTDTLKGFSKKYWHFLLFMDILLIFLNEGPQLILLKLLLCVWITYPRNTITSTSHNGLPYIKIPEANNTNTSVGAPNKIILHPNQLRPDFDPQTIKTTPLLAKFVDKPNSPFEIEARFASNSENKPEIEYFVKLNSTADPDQKYNPENYGNFEGMIEGRAIYDIPISGTLVPEDSIRLPPKLIFKNSRTNQLISNVDLNHLKPNKNESPSKITNGVITTDINDFGKHAFEFNTPGFTPVTEKFINYNGAAYEFSEKVIFLSPKDGEERVVLTWEKDPRDLDLHITDSRGKHVYYSKKADEEIKLDVDVTSGFGPETMTFKILPGVSYWFYVHHYSGDGNLSTSQAKIKIYGVEGLNEISIPSGFAVEYGGKQGYWDVFKILAKADGRYNVEVVNKIVSDQATCDIARKF